MPSHELGRTTRRSVLGAVAGVAGAAAIPRASARDHGLRVMTRNLYVGVDLFRLAAADDLEDVRRITGRLLEDAREHPYEARFDAIAAEVAAAEPDVLGVQEAALVRTRHPSEFDDPGDPDASDDVVVDLLDLLEGALDARGLDYEVAATSRTTDVEVPADDGGREVDLRLTDRTAVLVREEVEVADSRADRFEATFTVSLDGHDVALERGYCGVDVTVGGEPATVATAHLEAVDPGVRRDQAEELLDQLPEDRPVVVAGDVNSGPGGPTLAYDRFRESFADPFEALREGTDAPTCCHDPDLRSDPGTLSRRVDVVLYRGGLRATDVRRVGADPDERVTVEIDGETVSVWPSDHAGVVATFEFGAPRDDASTATPDETATRNGTGATDDAFEPQSGPGLPGATVATVAALAALARRREGE